MKRTREEEKEETIVDIIPIEVWRHILKPYEEGTIDVTMYDYGECIFSFACVNKKCHSISRETLVFIYNQAPIVREALLRFPVRAYYTMEAIHYSKESVKRMKTHLSEAYKASIHLVLIEDILESLTSRLLSTPTKIYNKRNRKVIITTTSFRMPFENMIKWIRFCREKHANDTHSTYDTVEYIKEKLLTIIGTPKLTNMTSRPYNLIERYMSQIEIRYLVINDLTSEESEKVPILRVSHDSFATSYYDFKL